jgi:hypothetical protein
MLRQTDDLGPYKHPIEIPVSAKWRCKNNELAPFRDVDVTVTFTCRDCSTPDSENFVARNTGTPTTVKVW